eukprot:scaffold300904_cov26-Tisochrysis_lutea.AAC.2
MVDPPCCGDAPFADGPAAAPVRPRCDGVAAPRPCAAASPRSSLRCSRVASSRVSRSRTSPIRTMSSFLGPDKGASR